MKRQIVAFSVCAFITAVISILLFLTLNNAVSQLPNTTQMTYNHNSEFYPITISKWENYQNRFSATDVSICSELDETDVKNNTVTPVLTNENFFSVMNISITGSLKENTKAAAVSSDLALKLYFNTDVIGKKLIINNSEYIISGVYEKPKGIVNELSSDGKECVYLYYSNYSAYKSQEIQSICYRNDAPSAPLIEQMNLSQYHVENIGEKAKILNNFRSLFFLIIFISLSVIALRIWYRLCGRLFSEIKADLSENYFFKSVRSIPLRYLLFTVTAAGIPLLIIIVFQFINFSIFIPSKYIPYDNIFDIPYYFSKIIEHQNDLNSISLNGNTYCFDLFHNSFNVLSVLLTAFVMIHSVFFVIINSFVNKYFKEPLFSGD
jgi:hypothetical protein